MPIHGNLRRELMRQWATGVTLVTAQDGDGPHGMTVSSFTSLSLEPPLILVSLEKGSRTHKVVSDVGQFAVVLLHAGQQSVAERFSGGIPDSLARFDGVPYRLSTGGSPILDDALAYLDCRVAESHGAGTHTIFIGEVLGGQAIADGSPLLYFNRAYRRMAE
jgi:flavin reductase (DIM6/NTAB) family NADH-FMN oxidoreductase RutF